MARIYQLLKLLTEQLMKKVKDYGMNYGTVSLSLRNCEILTYTTL